MKIVLAPHAAIVLELEAQLWAEVNLRLQAENARLRGQYPGFGGEFRAAWERASGEAIDRHLLEVAMLRRAAWLAPVEAA